MSSDDRSNARRRFLGTTLGSIPVIALGVSLPGARASAEILPMHDNPLTTAGPRAYTPSYFTATEAEFITAAVNQLIPSDEFGPSGMQVGVLEYIDRQMASPWGHGENWYMQGPFNPDAPPSLGYQLRLNPRELYRQGIAQANQYCTKRFGKTLVNLDNHAQVLALGEMEKGTAAFDGLASNIFFSFLLENVKEGYFTDPIYGGNQGMQGWKMIGFPGVRADYMDWVGQYNVKYPYGPVSIAGEEA